MISVDEATDIIANSLSKFPGKVEEVPASFAQEKILAENILSDRDYPPFNRVMKDGMAINSKDFKSGGRIEAVGQAGHPQLTLENSSNCIEIMTGAPLPIGCDKVIMYESLNIEDGIVTIVDHDNPEVNVHAQGSDRKKGAPILEKGDYIDARAMGLLAMSGHTNVKVVTPYKITLVTTGDELVDINMTPDNYQIRNISKYSLLTMLKSFGYTNTCHSYLPDNKEALEQGVLESLDYSDVVIVVGGVSRGKYDYIPQILEKTNITQKFYRVSQTPGKPLWFGEGTVNGEHKVVFGLPGNPVSSLVCLRRYVIPRLNANMGRVLRLKYVRLKSDFENRFPLSYFVPVKLEYDDDKNNMCIISETRNSGDFFSLHKSDGFIELQESRVYRQNEIVPFFKWGDIYA